MARNLERSGGVVMSESVMMALAPRLGRDRAHALVLEISREAAARGVPFKEVVAAHPEVRRRLTARRIAAALDPRNGLGLCGHFVDRVVAAHRAARGRRRREPVFPLRR
jgi:3-carboxy-cis,cis-muconate cycloisomerase